MPSAHAKARARGMRIQDLVCEILTGEGYRCHNQKPSAKLIWIRKGAQLQKLYVSARQDIFGCIDIIAVHASKPTKWIQSTSDTGLGRKLDAFIKADVPWNSLIQEVEIWQKIGIKHFKIFRVGQNSLGLAYELAGEYKRGTWFTVQDGVVKEEAASYSRKGR